jgi:hypothetical protein
MNMRFFEGPAEADSCITPLFSVGKLAAKDWTGKSAAGTD